MKIVDSNKLIRECVKVSLDNKFPGYIRVDFISKIRKGHRYSEWIPVDEFYANNPSFKEKLGQEGQPQMEDLGVVSKSGVDYFQDISKNWKKDAFVKVPVWISRGRGEGERRIVVKNNKNTIHVDKPWKTKPDKTSQYVLSFNVSKNIKAIGNTLPDVVAKTTVGNIIKKAKKSAIRS